MPNILLKALQGLFFWAITKVMLALGLSFVTYKGFELALDTLKGYLARSFAGIPSDAYNIMLMAGLGKAVGIIFGAFAFNAAMSATSKLTAGLTKK